jgi:hypothetical protein
MRAGAVSMICALVYQFRSMLPLLALHLEENDGQVLPHLVMSDIVRWMVEIRQSQPDVCRDVLAWLEGAYEVGEEYERDVIATSGVEMIPDPGDPGAELRDLLGPHLRSVDPWR